MKQTPLILTLCLLFSAGILQAQRIKDKRAKLTYVSLPERKLPDDYTTYSVSIYGRALVLAGTNSNDAAKRIVMDGFKLVSTEKGGGHLRIIVNTGSVVQGRADFKSQKNVTKDKAGKETTTWKYWYEVPFSAAPTYQIYDPEGNILDSGGSNLSEVKSTTSYGNSKDLSNNYTKLMSGLGRAYSAETTNNIISKVNASLARNFDFKKTSETPELFLIVADDTEDDYEKYYKQIDDTWKDLDAAMPTEELKAKFADALAFYKKEAEKDPKGDKKLSRMFEASNYNMALLSYYMDDFEESVRYCNRVIANEDGKHRKSSDLIEKVQNSKRLMDLHGINTMHYSRDLTNAMAPAAMKALEMAKEEAENATNTLSGTIMLNGEPLNGTFVSEKESKELDFSDKGNMKFVAEKDGKTVEYKMAAAEITAFSIGDRNFVKTSFAPCAKGKPEVGNHIMEELYSSDKITLYKYYPVTGALSEAKPEFAFKKAAEQAPVSLYDTKFLILKKGLANYFADCTDLKAMCEEGSVENEQESLMKAARIYAEVCQ